MHFRYHIDAFVQHGPVPNGDAHEWPVPIPGYYGSSADHLARVLLLMPSSTVLQKYEFRTLELIYLLKTNKQTIWTKKID